MSADDEIGSLNSFSGDDDASRARRLHRQLVVEHDIPTDAGGLLLHRFRRALSVKSGRAMSDSKRRISPSVTSLTPSVSSMPPPPTEQHPAPTTRIKKLSSSTFSLKRQSTSRETRGSNSVGEGLRRCYSKMVRPFEESCLFHKFHSPPLEDADFEARPLIMLVGQYSTGKTTFIRYLLGEDFPGLRIGPEPTTDKFTVIMHGEEKGVVPGNALAVDTKMQFRPLAKSKDRGYDYSAVLEWFAARVDRILVLFDANKLDISDELRRVMMVLKAHDEKIRIVLNKSDMVTPQQLMRVYGALMWSLGKVLDTPEVVRVYIGSFWEEPLRNLGARDLFQSEEHDLFSDIKGLPRHSALRKLNDFIKRARLVKIHALIISELAKRRANLFGKAKKKRELLDSLEMIYKQVQNDHDVSPGDFPDIWFMRDKLSMADWSLFKTVDKHQLIKLNKMLEDDMTKLMAIVPGPHAPWKESEAHFNGPIEAITTSETPFKRENSYEADYLWELKHNDGWVVANDSSYPAWVAQFQSLSPKDGKISGAVAKRDMQRSKLPNPTLGKIWSLADQDQDGMLSQAEYCLANYLIDFKLHGRDIPKELPDFLRPPPMQ